MKVLITGENSYIGSHIKNWFTIHKFAEVVTLSVRDDEWKRLDFGVFDSIIHVAAIVHKKEKICWELYKQINSDLTFEIAKKAKNDGCKHFVFLSSMAVFGQKKRLKTNCYIDITQEKKPKSNYGKSKLLAEEKLETLIDENFVVSIVRAPNVYGKECRGNYISLYKKIMIKSKIVPSAFNNVKQSYLHIDNLSEFCRLIIENKSSGYFHPQDDKALSTMELVTIISNACNVKIYKSKFLGFFVKMLFFVPIVKKAYGGIRYKEVDSTFSKGNYIVVDIQTGMYESLK